MCKANVQSPRGRPMRRREHHTKCASVLHCHPTSSTHTHTHTHTSKQAPGLELACCSMMNAQKWMGAAVYPRSPRPPACVESSHMPRSNAHLYKAAGRPQCSASLNSARALTCCSAAAHLVRPTLVHWLACCSPLHPCRVALTLYIVPKRSPYCKPSNSAVRQSV
jgi:hypothetical protein